MSDPPKQKPWLTSADNTVTGSTSGWPEDPEESLQKPGVVRPLGITVLCIVNFVVAGLLLVVIVLALLGVSGDKNIAFVALLPAVISLGLGFALWQMLPWARNTALVLYGVFALSAFANIFKPDVSFTDVLSIIVPGAIVAYLIQPKVQAAFDRNLNR